MSLFSRSRATSGKGPVETVKALTDSTNRIGNELKDKERERELETIHKMLVHMKAMIASEDALSEQVNLLSSEAFSRDLLSVLLKNMDKIGFESRKLVNEIFYHLIMRKIGTRKPTCEYIQQHPQFIYDLMVSYERGQEVALPCGHMLRYCIKQSDDLTKLMLSSPNFFTYFQYVEMQPFDVSSDAFSSFKDMLSVHKEIAADFLETNYEKFFSEYKLLLESGNYVTKRQSLKLLGELLLDRHNFSIMTRFISSTDNLKQIMNLLHDPSRSIQFESFHVFKVFVANPNKTREVSAILYRNKEKLIKFLSEFQTERQEDDQQFTEEKQYLIKQISDMESPAASNQS